jgi:hypothetical protein
MAIPSRCARGTNCSLGAQHVVLGDAQGGSSAPRDGEAPGATLRLVTRLVVHLGGDGVHPFRQAHGGGVGEAAGGVDLGGDHLAVDDECGAQWLHPRAGSRVGQGGGDDRPGAGDHRAVGRDGVADEGRPAVVLQAEEGGPLGPVVDVIRRLGVQVVEHARRHGRWVVGGRRRPGGRAGAGEGSAPVDVVAGHAAAGAIADSAPGEIRIVTRVLPYAVAGGTAGINRGRFIRRCGVVLKGKEGRPTSTASNHPSGERFGFAPASPSC